MVGCLFAALSLADPSEVSEVGSEIQALPQGGAVKIQKEVRRKESNRRVQLLRAHYQVVDKVTWK